MFHRSHFILGLIAALVSLSGAAGAAAQSNPSARITVPSRDQTVRGGVAIQGTAWTDLFTRYEVAYAAEPDLADWTVIGGAIQPVDNNLLAVWNTRPLPDGAYALRVQVFNSDGTMVEGYVRNITVANAVSAPGGAPAGGAPQAEPAPGAVDTSQAASLDEVGGAQEFNLAAIPDAFLRGARIALLAFAALGAYLVVKRLLSWIFRRWFARPVDYGK